MLKLKQDAQTISFSISQYLCKRLTPKNRLTEIWPKIWVKCFNFHKFYVKPTSKKLFNLFSRIFREIKFKKSCINFFSRIFPLKQFQTIFLWTQKNFREYNFTRSWVAKFNFMIFSVKSNSRIVAQFFRENKDLCIGSYKIQFHNFFREIKFKKTSITSFHGWKQLYKQLQDTISRIFQWIPTLF